RHESNLVYYEQEKFYIKQECNTNCIIYDNRETHDAFQQHSVLGEPTGSYHRQYYPNIEPVPPVVASSFPPAYLSIESPSTPLDPTRASYPHHHHHHPSFPNGGNTYSLDEQQQQQQTQAVSSLLKPSLTFPEPSLCPEPALATAVMPYTGEPHQTYLPSRAILPEAEQSALMSEVVATGHPHQTSHVEQHLYRTSVSSANPGSTYDPESIQQGQYFGGYGNGDPNGSSSSSGNYYDYYSGGPVHPPLPPPPALDDGTSAQAFNRSPEGEYSNDQGSGDHVLGDSYSGSTYHHHQAYLPPPSADHQLSNGFTNYYSSPEVAAYSSSGGGSIQQPQHHHHQESYHLQSMESPNSFSPYSPPPPMTTPTSSSCFTDPSLYASQSPSFLLK
ncbi:hypothetical protein TYRP_002705, partial [Tyrophagus putrescentiae]